MIKIFLQNNDFNQKRILVVWKFSGQIAHILQITITYTKFDMFDRHILLSAFFYVCAVMQTFICLFGIFDPSLASLFSKHQNLFSPQEYTSGSPHQKIFPFFWIIMRRLAPNFCFRTLLSHLLRLANMLSWERNDSGREVKYNFSFPQIKLVFQSMIFLQ